MDRNEWNRSDRPSARIFNIRGGIVTLIFAERKSASQAGRTVVSAAGHASRALELEEDLLMEYSEAFPTGRPSIGRMPKRPSI
jgi:hypothetical protein